MIKVLELFAGIGACSKALERIGIEHEIVDAVEIDKYAIKSFNAIHGTEFDVQDITKWDKDVEVDLIMHGSPCQDFSVAGKQAGGDIGSGTRSSLMYETIRIVGKLRPKYVIWENVKNLLSKKHRHNFDAYIETMNILGYNSYYQVLNAKDYGIPQNRERVFTISIRRDIDDGNFIFPEKETLELRLKDMLENEVDEKYYLTKTNNIVFNDNRVSWDNSGKGYNSQQDRAYYQDDLCPALSCCNSNGDKAQVVLEDKEIILKRIGGMYGQTTRWGVYDDTGLAPTLVAAMGEGGGYVPMVENSIRIRKLTPKECWRLMGFDDEDFEKAEKVNSNTQLYKQAGNSIVVNVLEKILSNLLKGE